MKKHNEFYWTAKARDCWEAAASSILDEEPEKFLRHALRGIRAMERAISIVKADRKRKAPKPDVTRR